MKLFKCQVRGFPTNFLVSDNATSIAEKICAGSKPVQESAKKCVLLIPGNPGGLSYYVPFCERIENQLGPDVTIYAVDHAGHCRGDTWSEAFSGTFFPVGLAGQLAQKDAFVDEFLPRADNLVVIGHSIGARMMLELIPRLRRSGKFGSVSGIGLFPTIERMAESPMGLKMAKVFAYFRWLVIMAAAIFTVIMPRAMRVKVIRWYFGPKVEDSAIVATDDIACPRAVSGIYYMAHDEMEQVRELDVDLLNELADSIFLYYGSRDAWTPRKYYDEMKQRVPKANATVCTKKFAHAFVLRHSLPVADECVDWLNLVFTDPQNGIRQIAASYVEA